jgi:t-SNARE complex subunit (syntaxin)
MPIATLRFTLPDEQAEYDAARQGGEARSLLWDIDQRCRAILKYSEPSEETARLAEEIREMIGASKVELD